MNQLCDLHTHSVYSDGTFTPTQLIAQAQKIGLAAVALTDHNTVAGLPEFARAAEGTGVQAVSGVEFSTEYEGTELHILGLFIGPEHYDPINSLLGEFLRRKAQSNRDLIHRLNGAGLALSYEDIEEKAAGQINRAVIGAQMVQLGYCQSVQQAFSQWLSPKRGYYVPPVRPDAFETVAFIKELGAVAVLAHPFLNLEEDRLRPFLKRAVPAGLDGMEVYYPVFDAQTTRLAREMAREFGLLESGGSDFHGKNKPHIALGTGMDNLQIPLEVLDRLKNRQKNPADDFSYK